MSLTVAVLFLASCINIGSSAFIDFLITGEDSNHVTLECYSSETGDIDNGAIIEFFRSSDPNITRSHRTIFSGDTFDLTPENESFLRCTSSDGTMQSDVVAIAGECKLSSPCCLAVACSQAPPFHLL